MKQFLLIAKNWFKSINKMKFGFSVFLILNLIFASSFTIFLEVTKQIKEQMQVAKYTENENTFGLKNEKDLYEEDFSQDPRFYRIFCRDYLEFRVKNPKTKTLLKRIPILTFGSQDGCFQAIDWTKLKWDYVQEKDGTGRTKVRFTKASFTNPSNILRLNKESKHYQGSIHQQLLAKYATTKNQEYADLAKQLEDQFFPKILNNIAQEMLTRVNNLDAIYLTESDNKIKYKDLINILSQKIELPDVATLASGKMLNIKDYWNKMTLSEKAKDKIGQLLGNTDQGLDQLINENKRKSKAELEKLINEIEQWKGKNFPLNLENIEDTNPEYQSFVTSLEERIATNNNNLLNEFISSAKVEHWIKWINQRQKQLTAPGKSVAQTKIDNWLRTYISQIKQDIRNRIVNPEVKLLLLIEKYNQQWEKSKENTNLKIDKLMIENQELTIQQLQNKIKNKELDTATIARITTQINNQLQMLNKYLEIKEVLGTNHNEWKAIVDWDKLETIIDQTQSDLTPVKINFISEFKQILQEHPVATIKELTSQQITTLHTQIKELLTQISQVSATLVQQINEGLQINADYKMTWNLWQWWKQNPIKINDWKNKSLNELESAEDDSDATKHIVTIISGKNVNNGWNNGEVSLNTFLSSLSPKAHSLSLKSSKTNLETWQKINFLLSRIFKKLIDYLFLVKDSTCNSKECGRSIKVLTRYVVGGARGHNKNNFWVQNTENKEWGTNNPPIFQPSGLWPGQEMIWPNSDVINNFIQKQQWGALLSYLNIDKVTKNQHFVNSSKKGKVELIIQLITLYKILGQMDKLDKESEPWSFWKNWFDWNHPREQELVSAIDKFLESILDSKLNSDDELRQEFEANKNDNNSKTDQILQWNQLWIKKKNKEQLYQILIDEMGKKDKNEELKNSENILQLIKKMETDQQLKNDLVKKLTEPTSGLIFQGFNLEQELDFPTSEIGHSFHHLITAPKNFNQFHKIWELDQPLPGKWEMVDNYLKGVTADSDREKKTISPNLFSGTALANWNEYRRNWFNKIIWNNVLSKWETNNILGPIYKKDLTLVLKATAKITNLDVTTLKFTNINDQKNQKSYLMVKPNDKLKINVIEGRVPLWDNEILISPILARSEKFKVGDKINLIGIQNLKIVGIGIQKEFLYQILGWINPVPDKNQGLFYTSQQAYENIFLKRLQKVPTGIYFNASEQKIIQNNGKNEQEKETYFQEFQKLNGGEGFTKNSIAVDGPSSGLNKLDLEISKDRFLQTPEVVPLSKTAIFPHIIGQKMVELNSQILSYATLATGIICLIIISFVTFYIIRQKIDNNRQAIGILKSLGVGAGRFLLGGIPLIILVFGVIFLGWMIGVFLQIPIFDTVESFFNFQFQKYNFNFGYLFISFGIVFVVLFLSVLFFHLSKLTKMSVRDLMDKTGGNTESKTVWLKDWLINRTKLNKYLFVKINYIFFSTIWKKIIISLITFIILTMVLTGNILLFTIARKTTEENYKVVNHNYELVYKKPISNNPLSRKRVVENSGYSAIVKNKENVLAPLENEGLAVFIEETDQGIKKQKQLKLETFSEILWFILPAHWKSINLNWLNEALKQNEGGETEKLICAIIIQILGSDLGVFKNKDQCLTEQATNFLPFQLDDPTKASKQIPVSANVVHFNPKKDELFTKSYGYVSTNNEIKKENKVAFYGLHEQTKAFNFKAQTQKKVFTNPNQNDDAIKVVVNERFLKERKMKVGDKFQAGIWSKHTAFQSGKTTVWPEINDWKYEDSYNHVKECDKICTFDKLDKDARFYNGIELNKRKNFEVTKGQIKYKGKTIRLVYRTKSGKYKPMLDITKVRLSMANKIIYPFQSQKNEKKEVIGKTISWFTRQIRDNRISTGDIYYNNNPPTFEIVDAIKEINEARVFMSQRKLNQLMSWPVTKDPDTNQYLWFNGRFSQSEKIEDFIYNIPIATNDGFVDNDTIDSATNKNILDFESIDAPILKKEIITKLTNYLVKMTIIFLISQVTTVFFFFIFILINIAKSIRENGKKLKLFGYGSRIIIYQLMQIILVPALLGFIVGSLMVRWFLNYLLSYISEVIKIEMFFDERIVWSLIILGILLVVVVFLIWKNKKQVEKINFQQIFQNT